MNLKYRMSKLEKLKIHSYLEKSVLRLSDEELELIVDPAGLLGRPISDADLVIISRVQPPIFEGLNQ